MTYMPELKDSLERAAERQRATAAAPPRRRRTLGSGTVVPAFGALIALAVVVGALVLAGHSKQTISGGNQRHLPTAASARRTAEHVLNGFSLPPGAVVSRLEPGMPSQLGSTSPDLPRLGLPHVIHLHRLWRLPERPQKVMNWIFSHERSIGGSGDSSSGSSGSSGTSGSTLFSFGGELDLPASGPTEAIIGYQGFPLSHGGTALRADVEVAWPAPALISSAVDRIAVAQVFVSNGHLKARGMISLTASRVRQVVGLLNSLSAPAARRAAGACIRGFHFPLELVFFKRGVRKPIGVGFVSVKCSIVWLALPRTPTASGTERFFSPSANQLRRLLQLLPRAATPGLARRPVSGGALRARAAPRA
jgi:hypothetical protein